MAKKTGDAYFVLKKRDATAKHLLKQVAVSYYLSWKNLLKVYCS